MEKFYSAPTDDCPEIILDKESNNFMLSGKSLPEDVTTFYNPVLEWLNEYSKSPNEETVMNVRLTYFNTASSKLLLDILMILESMSLEGRQVKINWHYPAYDDEMREAGVEYAEMVEVKFEYLSYGSDKTY